MKNETPSYNMNLTTSGLGKPLAHIKRRSVKSRLYEALFGKKSRMVVIIPEECVKSISFTPLDGTEGS